MILKLGGSVITYKDKPMTANMHNIDRLSREISLADPESLIIVHGGGSFGHPLAEYYQLVEGYKTESQLIGFSKTRQAMCKLNNIIIDSLIDEGVPAVGMSPSSFVLTKNDRIVHIYIKGIKEMLHNGFIPVLNGDAVIDLSKKFSILSGDQLIIKLALELNSNQIIFGSDVDGIYTNNPKLDKEAKLLQTISIKNLHRYGIGGSLSTDVTSGMFGKIQETIPAVNNGIKVILVNACKPNIILKALKGKHVVGTIIER